MSRIKYPQPDIISQQITQILDKSGLFPEKSEDLEIKPDDHYVRCIPVREKKAVVGMKAAVSIVAIAAVIFLTIVIGNYKPVQQAAPQALNMIPEDTTTLKSTENDNRVFRNDKISCSLVDLTDLVYGNDEEQKSYSGAYVSGTIVAKIASIEYENKDFTQFSINKNVYTRLNELYDQYYKGEMSGASALYTMNVTDAKLMNDTIISVVEDEIYSAKNIEIPYNDNRQEGFSYNVQTRKIIRLSDIFTNEELGTQQLKKLLKEQIANDNMMYSEEEINEYVETSVADNSWCFDEKKIKIFVNSYIHTEDKTTVSDNYKAFEIPMSQLTYLGSDYQ